MAEPTGPARPHPAAPDPAHPSRPPVVALDPADAARPGWAERIAALTRAAYRAGDPFPGLPVPDGARETADAVRADVRSGALIWVARDAAGELAGVLRVRPAPGTWEITRVATDPARRGSGAARALLATVDAAARREGVARVRLDAVVERCLPPFYARLGFRPDRHWLPGDKPLSEVTMIRAPGAPATPGPAWLPPGPVPALVVVWLLDAGGLTATIGDPHLLAEIATKPVGTTKPIGSTGGDAPSLAGIDVQLGPGPRAQADVLAALGRYGRRHGDSVRFPLPRARLRAHLMPRTVHPRLHARYRPAPGAEPALLQQSVTTTVARCS